jgi:glycosyltransferase involved in cell wall biosynthesis
MSLKSTRHEHRIGRDRETEYSVVVLSLRSSSYYVSSFINQLVETPDIAEVRAIVPSHSPETETINKDAIELTEVDVSETMWRSIITSANPVFAQKILEMVDISDPDILHVINEMRFPFHLLPVLKSQIDCSVVLTVHEPDPYMPTPLRSTVLNPLQRHNLNLLSRYTDRFIVHGETLKRKLTKQAPADRIAVVPHGSLAEYFTRWKDGTERVENNVLFFGEARPGKGVPYLIKAGKMLIAELSDVTITIAGSGYDVSRFGELNHDQFILYDNRVSEKEAAKLFQRASVVVMPYTDASASGIVSIAGGFSTPVVATDVGCLPEMIEHEETGLIVPAKNSMMLYDALLRLLRNDSLRTKLGTQLHQVQQQEYSWDQVVKETIDIYKQSLVDSHPSARVS